MAIPTYEDCMLPFLKAISGGGTYPIRDIIEHIADALSLSHDERMEMLSSGQ